LEKSIAVVVDDREKRRKERRGREFAKRGLGTTRGGRHVLEDAVAAMRVKRSSPVEKVLLEVSGRLRAVSSTVKKVLLQGSARTGCRGFCSVGA
jgi:hypothetical protein